ncbi:MAG TPA: hypothetical protein VFA18_24620, partial [Gemmataceae bacterium]|nr:hypothetical protein [Gemmataceae bacterium]
MPDRSAFDQTGDYHPAESGAPGDQTTVPTEDRNASVPAATSTIQALRATLGSLPKIRLREPDASDATPVATPETVATPATAL